MALKNEDEKHEAWRQAFQHVASTEQGLTVLRFFYDATGYGADIMRYNPITSELNPNASLYNLSRRDVWKEARRFLSPENKAKVETQEKDND